MTARISDELATLIEGYDRARKLHQREACLLILIIAVLVVNLITSIGQTKKARLQRDEAQDQIVELQARVDAWERFDDLPRSK